MLQSNTNQELTIEEGNHEMKILETNAVEADSRPDSDQVLVGPPRAAENDEFEEQPSKEIRNRSQSHYSMSRIPTATGSRNDNQFGTGFNKQKFNQ